MVYWETGLLLDFCDAADFRTGGLTYVDHLLQTFGTDSMQTAQKFGFPTVRIVAVVADFTFQLLQGVNQRAAPGLHLNKPQQRLEQRICTCAFGS